MGLKGEKKVDYELTLDELERQRRRATSVPGRCGEHRHGSLHCGRPQTRVWPALQLPRTGADTPELAA